jgi:hypothetical protein
MIRSDTDALVKLIRLIGNLLTVPAIGCDILSNHLTLYRDLVKKLRMLVHNRDVETHQELVFCALSTLANATYYDSKLIATDFEFKNTQMELILSLAHYIMQT